ncbi:hypothetical protein GH714_038129 [Hevea brasiliensis]|uniref:Glycosyl hydrolase family 32 N-terminal domain-containing protein n=1 Tax=Hevea brasiliensis TaxID=3981 RepID=A0A6A6KQI7_HEVBR|nr:hypothetical protein GH714_038129 [Hevea brasiliensis]
MYYNGIYHLFYQYNPKGAVWGNIVWAHSVSKDLINWEALDHAIYPSKWFDINGCWSGSATILPGNKPVILYTGIDPKQRQIQNYAVPKNLSDPYLREWVKPDDNPLVDPDKSVNASAFRDPTTAWWVDGHWRTLIGSRRKHRGIAYLYRSKDFKRWVKAKPPFIQLRKLVSLDRTRYEYYTVGTYDLKKDRYIPDNTSVDGWAGLRFDYGNFYASKTFFDPSKNRRILWGWANESDSVKDDKEKGWAGIQAIPRKIWLDANGKQVLQWPVEELETLRGQSLDKAERFDPKWANIDALDVCAQKGSKVQGGLGPFGLLTLASEKLEEFTPVFFRIFKAQTKHVVLLCSDARRVYPTLAVFGKAHLFVFNNGSETIKVENLNAWSMKKPLMNAPIRI